MEYINIISKEPITTIRVEAVIIIGLICILAVLSTSIYWIKTKDDYKTGVYLITVGCSAIVFEVIALCFCSVFFRVPTDTYKYEATINKDKITITQYEDFIERYAPTIKDGIYYWEE